MKRLAMAALLCIGAGSPVMGIDPPTALDRIGGEWEGKMTQTSDGLSKTYAMKLKLGPQGGEAEYAELNCASRFAVVGHSGDYAFFTESVTRGAADESNPNGCIGGAVTAFLLGDDLSWHFTSDEGGAMTLAIARLKRIGEPPKSELPKEQSN